MSDLHTIESAVKQLSGAELQEFRSWFTQFDSKNWDAQLENDIKLGKLDSLADDALVEFNAGKATEFWGLDMVIAIVTLKWVYFKTIGDCIPYRYLTFSRN